MVRRCIQNSGRRVGLWHNRRLLPHHRYAEQQRAAGELSFAVEIGAAVQRMARALIFAVGVVHLLPLSGVLSADRLESLYGVAVVDPDLLILMRHRAVLFGIVAGLLIAAALHDPLRRVGIAAGLVSMLSFVVIALLAGSPNAELQRVVAVDVASSLALVSVALWDQFAGTRGVAG